MSKSSGPVNSVNPSVVLFSGFTGLAELTEFTRDCKLYTPTLYVVVTYISILPYREYVNYLSRVDVCLNLFFVTMCASQPFTSFTGNYATHSTSS